MFYLAYFFSFPSSSKRHANVGLINDLSLVETFLLLCLYFTLYSLPPSNYIPETSKKGTTLYDSASHGPWGKNNIWHCIRMTVHLFGNSAIWVTISFPDDSNFSVRTHWGLWKWLDRGRLKPFGAGM